MKIENWKLKIKKSDAGFTQPQRRGDGFTIPELLVSLFMFSLIIGGATNLLLSGITAQRSSLAMQELLDQSSFVVEYMTRSLRQAQKNLDSGCLANSGLNYEITQGGQGVKFLNVQGQCQEFFLEAGRIKERLPAPQFLVSDNVVVTSLQFILYVESQDDHFQPRLTFAFEIDGRGVKPESRPKLQFQTTISQRNVDVPN